MKKLTSSQPSDAQLVLEGCKVKNSNVEFNSNSNIFQVGSRSLVGIFLRVLKWKEKWRNPPIFNRDANQSVFLESFIQDHPYNNMLGEYLTFL